MTLHFRNCLAELREGLGKGSAWFVSLTVFTRGLWQVKFLSDLDA